MPNNDFPVLDGVCPSWADILVRATPMQGGAPSGALIDLKDIKAINTEITVEVGEQQGASGGRVMKRTTGQVKYSASMTLYRDGYQRFMRALMALAPSRGNQRLISLVHFGVQIQHTPPGSVEIFEYRLKGCRVLGRTMNSAEGTDAQEVEVPLSVLEIVDMVDAAEVARL